MSPKKQTPLMRQYNRIKKEHPQSILLFRVGDFYETFGSDAELVSRELGITLTKRNNGGDQTPLAGFPFHALDSYLPKLVNKRYKVAICEQTEDPESAKKAGRKIVEREVTEITTPGLSLSEKVLNHNRNNYIFSIYKEGIKLGCAFADISTGEFGALECEDQGIDAILSMFEPSELVIAASQKKNNGKDQNNFSSNSGGYFFYDLNGKINHKISEKNRLYFSHYAGKDKAYLDAIDNYSYDSISGSETTNSILKWGNIISALRWNNMPTNKLFINTTLRYSKYNFLIAFGNNNSETTNNIATSQDFSFAYVSNIEDWSGKIDFDWMPNPDHLVKFGIGDIYHTFTPGVNQFQFTNSQDTLSALDTTFGAQKHFAHEISGFIEDEWTINSRLKGNGGIHYSSFLVGKSYYSSIQPRFGFRYLINDESSFKFGYAEMAQFLHLLTNSGIGLPTDLWVPATEKIKPQFSKQIAIGLAKTFLNKFEVSIEGYYKTMENLIEYKDGASFFDSQTDWQDKVFTGSGRSYGGELLLEKKVGKTTGWIGYTLSWTNRQFDSINFGETYPYRYDRRHDIGIALTHEFNNKINFGIVWVYGTGNAVTLAKEAYSSFNSSLISNINSFNLPGQSIEVGHISNRNNYRMPSYHRLDISINLKKQKKWGERTWSFGVYNAYNRQNPFYLDFTTDVNGNPQLSQFSLFPLIPSFTYAFKF